MQHIWHKTSAVSELKTGALQQIKPGELRVKALYSAISHGSERLVCSGLVNNSACFEVMRVPYMSGDFSLPCSYGYSMIGEVIELAGSNPSGIKPGELVHLMHPHQDEMLVKSTDVTALPANTDPKLATLIANTETIINAIWDAEISLGDNVVIFGFGTIGALLALALKSSHFGRILIVESDSVRYAAAKSLNFEVTDSLEHEAKEFTVAFNTTANETALAAAIKNLEVEGKIIELSWYGKNRISLSLGEEFHYKRLHLVSSQVSNIPARRFRHWSAARRKQLVIELILSGAYDALPIKTIPFEDAPKFFSELRSGKINNLISIFSYQ